MTTPTLAAPTAAEPLTLSIAVKLGGFRFTPEVLKPDGLTRSKNPTLVLDAAHEGDAGAEELFGFLTHVRGDLKIRVSPATVDEEGKIHEESDIDGWQGVGTLGTVKLELQAETAVRFPLRIENANVQILEDLIGLRLAMSRADEPAAYLELEAVQPDLDFGDGDDAE